MKIAIYLISNKNEVSIQGQSDVRDINQLYNRTSTEASSNLRTQSNQRSVCLTLPEIRADARQDVDGRIRKRLRIISYDIKEVYENSQNFPRKEQINYSF